MTWNSLILIMAVLLLAKGTFLIIWPERAESWQRRNYSRLVGAETTPPALIDQPFYRTVGAGLCIAAFVLVLIAEKMQA
jgi:hypothetical protein